MHGGGMRRHATAVDGAGGPAATVTANQDHKGVGFIRPSRLLGAEEVALVLGVPTGFVYALARRGELPTVRIGERYVRFRSEALERWITEQESIQPRGTR